MKGMTVGELVDFLIEQSRSAKVSVVLNGDNIIEDSCMLTDVIYLYSREENEEEVILIYERV